MKRNLITTLFLFFFVLALLTIIPVQAQTQNQQETLKQYIAELRNNPANDELREKIIKIVLDMKVKPVMPKDAIKYRGAWQFAFKEAKTELDFANAAKEYEKVLLLAPWSAEDYFNSGTTYEKAGNISAAIKQFNFYLLASPDAKDANDVLQLIGALEYKAKKEVETIAQLNEAQKKEELHKKRISAIIAEFKHYTEERRYYQGYASAVKPYWSEYVPNHGSELIVAGVNEEEFYAEGVWYKDSDVNNPLLGEFSFNEEGKILFYTYWKNATAKRFPTLVGTPVIIEDDWGYDNTVMNYQLKIIGPPGGKYVLLPMEHIVWEVPELKGGIEEPVYWDGKSMSKRVWARYNYLNTEFRQGFYVSYDRPADEALYSSNKRYKYQAYWYYY